MAPPDSASPPAAPPAAELKVAGFPKDPEALFAAGLAHHRAGRLAEAAPLYAIALALAPADTRAANNLGVALRGLGKREAAEVCYRRLLSIEPDKSSAWVNLGNVLRDLGRLDDAENAQRRALALNPQERGAWYGLGLIAKDRKRMDEAIAFLERARQMEPNDPDINWDLAQAHLTAGNYAQGWAFYEWRWKLKDVTRPAYGFPEWDGSPRHGRSLLLYGEQGFGDAIQFSRFAPLLVQDGPVVLHVRPELLPLFDGQFPGITLVGREDKPPACDLQAPLLSIPHLLGLGAKDIPPAPYLTAPDRRHLLPEPPPGTRLRVGLVWQGSPTQKNDRNRSLSLTALLPLLRHHQVQFFSLQKGAAVDDAQRSGILPMILPLDPVLRDFADTAGVLAQLDLLIAVDTSVIHVAAALGRPVWCLLSVFHDWRFDARDGINDWYSSVRVFKQKTPGDWDDVVARVDTALELAVAGAPLP